MKHAFSMFAIFVFVLMMIFGMLWLVEGNEFFLYKFFAPKRAAVEREVFENTKSYRQGMIQELENMQFEYEKADDKHKEALRSIILHRAADFPLDQMPMSLRNFIVELKTSVTQKKGY